MKAGLPTFVRTVQQKADDMQEKYEKHADVVYETVNKQIENHKNKISSLKANVMLPLAEFDGWDSGQEFIYGFANGAVDVFPFQSLPDRCRGNVTSVYQAVNNLFFADPLPYSWPEDDVEYMFQIQDIMQFPYGVSFSCAFSFLQIFITDDPVADGELT